MGPCPHVPPTAARGSLLGGSWGSQPLRACKPCLCPPDEKEESILGSIPLLSFRVAAVQPSDNISRKHTFKVSAWLCRSGAGGGMEHWDSAGVAVMLAGSPLLPLLAFLVTGHGASWGEG